MILQTHDFSAYADHVIFVHSQFKYESHFSKQQVVSCNYCYSEDNLIYSTLHVCYVSIHPYVIEINFMGLICACRAASTLDLHL